MAGADADVIVVGAGVAGCVVARRLADTGLRTLLLEAGPATPPDPRATAGPLAGLAQPDRQWVENDRSTAYLRGKGAGGGSAINGMMMMAGDADDLRRFGGTSLVDELLRVTDELAPRPRSHGPLSRAFRSAALALGHRSAASSAALDQTGLLTGALALDRSGRRSVADAYLERVSDEPVSLESELLESVEDRSAHLVVEGGTEVIGLVMEGPEVTGVRAMRPGSSGQSDEIVLTGAHVVLSMGALASPRLLLAAGIGNHHVGRGLKDHPAVPLTIEMENHGGDQPVTTGLRWSSALGPGDLFALPMESIGTEEEPRGLVLTMALRVESEGGVGIEGAAFDHLAHPDDRLRMRTAVRDVAALLETADLATHCSIDDRGTRLADLPSSDTDLEHWIADHLGGVFHAGCSCRFGAALGPGGVVLGERGISVIDASVMPDLPAGNPQLSVMAWASWLAGQLAEQLTA